MRAWRTLLLVPAVLLTGAAAPPRPYADADFARIPKLDAHVHANVDDPSFLALARRDGFELLSINVDYPDFPPLATQAAVAYKMRARDPKRFHFATTFSMKGFGAPGWTARAEREVDEGLRHGAVAVKVWKNIGMVARDAAGKRVFAGFGNENVALARRRQKRDRRLLRDRHLVAAVAGVREGAVGEREDHPAMRSAMPVEHVGADEHPDPSIALPDFFQLKSPNARGSFRCDQRLGDTARERRRHGRLAAT